MPTASVATMKSTSPAWYISTCALRVRGDRRAQNHCGAASLTADQLRDGVDLLGRERHDGAAPGQAGELALAHEGEVGQARPRDERHVGQQALERGRHGRGADHHGLVASAPVQKALGEHVPAVEIGGELDFVHGDEGDVEIARHGLDRGDPVARVARLDLLLAGDEGHLVRAHARDDLVVDLAGEQAQRQADDPAGMAQHALDGEMGLAGVGGTEHRRDAPRLRLAGARRRDGRKLGHLRGLLLGAGPFCITIERADHKKRAASNNSRTNRGRIDDSA